MIVSTNFNEIWWMWTPPKVFHCAPVRGTVELLHCRRAHCTKFRLPCIISYHHLQKYNWPYSHKYKWLTSGNVEKKHSCSLHEPLGHSGTRQRGTVKHVPLCPTKNVPLCPSTYNISHIIMKNYMQLASTRQHNHRMQKMFFLSIKQADLLCPKW